MVKLLTRRASGVLLECPPYRVSGEALKQIEALERRQRRALQTAHLYWFD